MFRNIQYTINFRQNDQLNTYEFYIDCEKDYLLENNCHCRGRPLDSQYHDVLFYNKKLLFCYLFSLKNTV